MIFSSQVDDLIYDFCRWLSWVVFSGRRSLGEARFTFFLVGISPSVKGGAADPKYRHVSRILPVDSA